jgi:hypothetical protein
MRDGGVCMCVCVRHLHMDVGGRAGWCVYAMCKGDRVSQVM